MRDDLQSNTASPPAALSFSVVIPVYNGAGNIAEALRSCLTQSLIPKEILVVDDCSTDETVSVVRKLQSDQEWPCTISLASLSENSGPAAARNYGWSCATGDYVAFLDSDDHWHPEKLARCSRTLQKYGAIKILGHREKALFGAVQLRKVSRPSILAKNFAITPNLIVKRDIEERFDETMRFTEDHDLILRISRQYPVYLLVGARIPTSLGRRPMSGGGLSGHRIRMRLGELYMYRKFLMRDLFSFCHLPLVTVIVLAKLVLETLRSLKFNADRRYI